MSNSSIWLIDMTLPGATTPAQNGPGSKVNEGLLCNPQISKTEAFQSEGLMSYPGHSLEESYPSTKIQSVYYAAPADWVTHIYQPLHSGRIWHMVNF